LKILKVHTRLYFFIQSFISGIGGAEVVQNIHLSFQDDNQIVTKEMLFSNIKNTFTIEFWAKPERAHTIGVESGIGISKLSKQQFAIVPVFGAYLNGDPSRAGVGVSVGINGVSVYEHTINHLPATLVYKSPLRGWNHIAIVYNNKKPTLFINGHIAKSGIASTKTTLVPSGIIGGESSLGYYHGSLKDIRIWSVARTQGEINKNMDHELTGREKDLFGYWKLDEGTGNIANDFSGNNNHGVINGAKWISSNNENSFKKDMNILFTFFIPSGGVETLNRQRSYALSQKGINCNFLYTQPGTGLHNKINAPIYVTNDDNRIKEIIKNGNYTAIVVGSDLVMLQRLRKLGYTDPLIYEVQGLGYNKEYAEEFLKKNAYPIINSACDAILYPKTPHLIKAFETHFPLKEKFSFHNCFNTTEFKYQILPKKEKPIIGWVGRLEENKNWRDFLLIGAKLIASNPSIQLWMFEDNTLSTKETRSEFEKKISELNLRPFLTIYANQPHSKMAEYFSIIGDSGGFLCSTSKVEGFGYAVLEAMVCRCPVLSSDSDGVRSFITHNVTGKFFELGNISHAVHEGKELLTNFQLRELIRQNGVEHIEKNFSPENYAVNFINMIKKLQAKVNK
jgi:glycosyltransferase involved in cell wall biosynthesis